jgi:hypothetical protein
LYPKLNNKKVLQGLKKKFKLFSDRPNKRLTIIEIRTP